MPATGDRPRPYSTGPAKRPCKSVAGSPDVILSWSPTARSQRPASTRTAPLFHVIGIRPRAVDPFEENQSRAIDEFLAHSHGHQRGFGSRRRQQFQ